MNALTPICRRGTAGLLLGLVFAALLLAEEEQAEAIPGKAVEAPKAAGTFKVAPPAEIKQAMFRELFLKNGKHPSGNSVPKGTPWVWSWEQYDAVPKKDQKTLYRLVAEHLLIADNKYIKSKEIEIRRDGLGLAVEACRCSTHRLNDHQTSHSNP